MVQSNYRRAAAGCQRESAGEENIRVFLPKEPERIELSITAVLYALSDEIRLGIALELAARGPLACGAFQIERPKSSLSHHFRVLRESGIVATRREGTALVNTLRREDLDTRFPGLLGAILGPRSKSARAAKPTSHAHAGRRP